MGIEINPAIILFLSKEFKLLHVRTSQDDVTPVKSNTEQTGQANFVRHNISNLRRKKKIDKIVFLRCLPLFQIVVVWIITINVLL